MSKAVRNKIFSLDEKIKTYVEEMANNTVEAGNYFCNWCLTHLFELSEDEIFEATKYSE